MSTTTAAAAAGGGSSSPVSGLLLALAAAAGNNIGKGLQKAATAQLPQLNIKRKEALYAYLTSPMWLFGLLLDVAGGGAMLAALAAAPVSVVQPVAAFGLVLLAAFSHFVLKERLNFQQWRGAAVAAAGIMGMGISSSSSNSSTSSSEGSATAVPVDPAAAAADDQPSPLRILTCFLLLLLLLAAEIWWRQQREAAAAAQRKRAGAAAGVSAAAAADAAAADAAACGVEAGCCFGLSAAAARTGFQLSRRLGWLFVPLGVAGSLCLTSSGFVLQTRGFKHGSALVVCTAAAAASIVAGVLVGLLALAEPLPATTSMRLLLLASWAAVFIGISSMAAAEQRQQHGGSSSSNKFYENHHSGANLSPTHAGSSSKGLLITVANCCGMILRPLLLLLPKDLRRRVLPHPAVQWLGRSGSFSSSSSSSSKRWLGIFGSGGSSSSGPALPVSRNQADFAGVIAPMGGARRTAV